MRWNIPSAGLVLFLFERSGRMGKVLIWFVIIISTVVLYCLMKVKAESDELYEELMRKHFYGKSDDIPESDKRCRSSVLLMMALRLP